MSFLLVTVYTISLCDLYHINQNKELRAILNKSWQQHPTRHQLYGHLCLPSRKLAKVDEQTRHAGHCWRRRDELISDVLLWTPTYGRAKAGRPARTYIQQLCEDTGCSSEDLPEAMNDREKWRERVRDNRAGGMRWWWYIEHSFKFIWNSSYILYPNNPHSLSLSLSIYIYIYIYIINIY